jgi:molybdate transport system substrate-binding protein
LRLRSILLAVPLAALFSAQPVHGQEISVAAAADLQFAMRDLAGQFEKQTGIKVSVTYGSSGNFFAQLQYGVPFDLFFSADIDYPKRLESAGLTEVGTLCMYAVGRIVIWTPADSRVDVAKQGWSALLDASVEKIAIANPGHAPYGRAAVAALQKAGIYEQVKAKLVYGENISQAVQFVQSGSAQAGIIALSLATSPPMKDGKSWQVPMEIYPGIEQGAVVLKDAKNKDGARAFLQFVKSEHGRAILAKHGFGFSKKDEGREKLTQRR